MRETLRRLEDKGARTALILEDGRTVSYETLASLADAAVRDPGPARRLLLIEAKNALEPLAAYIGAVRAGHPIILLACGTLEKDRRILGQYRPAAAFLLEDGQWGWHPGFDGPGPVLHDDLALLLSTSGTTGASKMVTLSRRNLESNAASIVEYLEIDEAQRPITTLPFYYSYGLSVIHSHLMAGAAILLEDRSVSEPEFWDFFRRERATSFAGVPYTFELLERIGFDRMELPSLEAITQAGGRLAPQRVHRYATLAKERGVRFFVMYGQTEATARIAYLPPERVLEYPECIGLPIPGGALSLIDEQGEEIAEAGRTGELVYRGPNVMMHYSFDHKDLARGPELDALRTGDIAYRNEAGYFRITGRMNRFSKLFGLRISLDEVETFLAQKGVRAVCAGDDEGLVLGVLDRGTADEIRAALIQRFGLTASVLAVLEMDELPLLDNGKTDYRRLLRMGREPAREAAASRGEARKPGAAGAGAEEPRLEDGAEDEIRANAPGAGGRGAKPRASVAEIFRKALNVRSVRPSDTFVSLGGDSLCYVEVSLGLERLMGALPEGWEKTKIADLERRLRARPSATALRTDVLFRAFAIVMVVAQHAGFRSLGGAGFLILLAGLNTARFQGEALLQGRVRSIGRSVFLRVLLPYFLILGAYQLAKRDFQWADWLLISNFFDRTHTFVQPYWFIQAFAQCIAVLALLFLIPAVRRLAGRAPYLFGAMLLVPCVAMRLAAPALFEGAPNLPYVTPMVLYLFILGWCAFHTRTRLERAATSLMILCLASFLYTYPLPAKLTLLVGSILVLWIPRIRVPALVHRPVSWCAAAVFYIYLVHQVPVHVLTHTIKPGFPLLGILAGVVCGILAWQGVRKLEGFVAALRRKEVPLEEPASAPPSDPPARPAERRLVGAGSEREK